MCVSHEINSKWYIQYVGRKHSPKKNGRRKQVTLTDDLPRLSVHAETLRDGQKNTCKDAVGDITLD